MPFADRAEAGRRLAERLQFLRGQDVTVLGLPRGGVPVAYEVARSLGASLDVILVRKLGVPFQPELAMGAISEAGIRVVNERVVRMADVSAADLDAVESRERAELERRAELYRSGRPPRALVGRTVVIVDDGMATGATARAACRAARAAGAERVMLAVPVASPEALVELGSEVEVVCVEAPRNLWAVGEWYQDFSQVPDRDVVALLERAGRRVDVISELQIPAGPVVLEGDLVVPEGATALVVFAHGSGSSRHSPRNRFVAEELNRDGLGTLLFDLLTPAEEVHRDNVFDIDLLGQRLAEVTRWLESDPRTERLAIGYFGASTGAAAALWAASEVRVVGAVVSRGGRPDLAGPRIELVAAPTLLIVGGRDTAVLELNRRAQTLMSCENRLQVVPGATHLFEEPGALVEVARAASEWFGDHLRPVRVAAATGDLRL